MAAGRARELAKLVAELERKLTFEGYYEQARIAMLDLFAQYGNLGGALSPYEELLRAPMGAAVDKLLTQVYMDYQESMQIVNSLYSDLPAAVSRQLPAIRAAELTLQARMGDYEEATIEAIAREFRAAALAREDADAFALRLAQKVDGKAKGYALTMGRTMIKAHSRAMVAEKAKISGCAWFAYTGPAVWTSGPRLSHRFCVELMRYAERHFRRDEIGRMRNSQLEPVLMYCAGYRCRHAWEPDPLYKPSPTRKVQFLEVMDGKRIITVGKVEGSAKAQGWEIKPGDGGKKKPVDK